MERSGGNERNAERALRLLWVAEAFGAERTECNVGWRNAMKPRNVME